MSKLRIYIQVYQDIANFLFRKKKKDIANFHFSSVTDTCSTEGNGATESFSSGEQRNWGEIKVPTLHHSISLSDLLNHIGNSIEGNRGTHSVSSNEPRNWDEIKVPGIHPSMSMSDLVNHIGNHISENMTTGDSSVSVKGSEIQGILEDIAQYLLNDTQLISAPDEKVMSRVNSLCCLLQDSASAQDPCANTEICSKEQDNMTDLHSKDREAQHDVKGSETDANDMSVNNQTSGMSRKDSFGDLLLHLPRITSLPKFLFDISEEGS